MPEHESSRLVFDAIAWEQAAPGWRVKRFESDGKVIRLVELTDALEPESCSVGHVGYVVAGRFTVEFDGGSVVLQAGDGLHIPDGDATKHVPRVAPGESALLFLVEDAG